MGASSFSSQRPQKNVTFIMYSALDPPIRGRSPFLCVAVPEVVIHHNHSIMTAYYFSRFEKRGKQRCLLSRLLIFRPKPSKNWTKRKALDERGSHEIV